MTNGLVFIWQLVQGFNQEIFLVYGEIPNVVLQGKQLYTLVTSIFLHGDFFHIFGNMLYLFIFGDNVEDRFGHTTYFILYFIFGIMGGLAHSVVAVLFGGIDALIPAIGASGAISGILGSYLVFFPSARIVSVVPSFYFMRLARVPAVLFIGFWFILQLLFIGDVTTVAYMAHIGGFITGLVIALIFKPRRRLRERYAKYDEY